MFKWILIFLGCFIIWFILYLKQNHVEVKARTFLKKGFLVDNGPYGVYCYTGKQGRGKTYSVIEFLREHKDYKIYTNLKVLRDVPYIYIGSFEELLEIQNDTSENIIIFYDEIFTALTKQDKLTKQVLGFLSQMRKRKIIFLTTAQEWLEINVTLRRYVRFQIDCNNRSFFGRSYLIKTFYDGELMHWDNDLNEYTAPVLSCTISKMNKCVADSYDTYEVIESSNKFYKINQINNNFRSSDSIIPSNPNGDDSGITNNEISNTEEQYDNGFWEEKKEVLIEKEEKEKNKRLLDLLKNKG